MTPTIRPANQDDRTILIKLIALLGYEVTETEVADRLTHLLHSPDHGVLVAVFDNHVVGFIHIFIKRLLERPVAGEIGGMAVDQSMQGKGLGRQLVAAAEAWAKEQGCQRLVVKSNMLRQPTHAFYQAIGYISHKRQAVFEKSIIPSSLT